MDNINFNGFKILEILPRGGMSTVYKARQLSLDRIVAIKALPPTMGVDPVDAEKFMAEAKITAGMKHPNIVQVYDFGKSDSGVYYFVMEYISGYSVAAWIRRKRYLSEENSLLCALSIASAMNYAWEKAGIVHCDIKPDNVIIDGDGTVKVADLGLATSVKSISGQTRAKDTHVFGTPNYISPEQSRGDDKLDCRADIYSLGAMLYHCMTGVMPFEEIPSIEVMDRQITDQIPDPQDVNPSVSVWSACLIEKMMAKNSNNRQKDWKEAIRDISNARSEMMPQGILPPEIASTVKRSAMRENRVRELRQPLAIKENKTILSQYTDKLAAIKKKFSSGSLQEIIVIAAGVVLLFAIGWGIFSLLEKNKIKTALQQVEIKSGIQSLESDLQKSSPILPNTQDGRERNALKKYNQVMAWFKANPAKFNEAALRFSELAEEIRGTKCSDMARWEIRKLEKVLAEIKTITSKLDKSAAAQNNFLKAAAVYEKYHGPYEKETAGARKKKALFYHAKQTTRLKKERQLNRKISEKQLAHAVDEIAMIIVEDDINVALWRLDDLASDLPLISSRPEFKKLAVMLNKSAGASQIILDSFWMQKDQEVNILFLNGPQKLFIRDVRDDMVIVEDVWKKEQGTIILRRVFALKDLALAEKIGRIGNNKGPEYALMRVTLALQNGEYQKASAAAVKTGPLLSKSLGEAIALRSKNVSAWRATQGLAYLFRRAGIYYTGNIPDPVTCLDLVRSGRQSLRQGIMLNRAVAQFRSRFGSTEIGKAYDEVLAAITNTEMHAQYKKKPTSSLQVKPDTSSKLPRQVTGPIISKLIEENSGLREDQIVFQTDDSGRIIMAEIISTHLRDIKALENLVDIQQLTCAGMRHNAWLDTPVIASLSDLMPLEKMSLRELTVNHTRVKDISILSQMPLSVLNLAHTRVKDLEPLKGMPLKYLDVSFTPVRDIRPLAGLSLERLNINGTAVSDLKPLADMPLTMLSAVFTRVKDLSPLRNMPLQSLVLRNTDVTDLSPLRGMPLEYLNLADTSVRNISMLQGMRLRDLDLSHTKLKTLEGLEQMPLERLKINGTAVRDISLVRNMPLRFLDLRNTGITDLSPINNSLIEELWLDDLNSQLNGDKIADIMTVLQTMPKLKSVNGKSVRMWSGRD